MIDYLLKFPSQEVAEQFGITNGFAAQDEDGIVQTRLASLEHALWIIGEHEDDGQYWVLFRDLVGIPIPEGGEQFIYWASDFTVDDENGDPIPVPRPTDDPTVPNAFWLNLKQTNARSQLQHHH